MLRLLCLAPLIGIALGVVHAADNHDFIATHPPRFYPGSEFPGAKGTLTTSADFMIETSFDFSGGGNYVETGFDLDGTQAVKSIAFEADKSNGYTFTVRVRDANGQTFQKSLSHRLAGWTQFRFDMHNWRGHWGAPNDGVLQQPLQGFSILIENTHQPDPIGSMKLKHIVFETYTAAELAIHNNLTATLCSRVLISDFREVADTLEPRSFNTYGGVLENGALQVDFSKSEQATLNGSLSIPGVPQELLLTIEADPEAVGAEFELGIGSHFMTYTRKLGTVRTNQQK